MRDQAQREVPKALGVLTLLAALAFLGWRVFL